MDFLKFTFSKKYVKSNMSFELFFDFDLKEITGHNRKTFDDYKSLLFFLENHAEREVFVTQTQTQDSFEDGNKIVINLKTYQEFCKKIGQTGRDRTQAFLAQKVKHYSEDEKKEIIAGSTEEQIIERLKNFTVEQKQNFLEKLKNIEGMALPATAELALVDISESNILDVVKRFNPDVQGKIIESLKSVQVAPDDKISFNVTEKNVESVILQVVDSKNKELVKKNLKQLEKDNFENLDLLVGLTKFDKAIDFFEKNILSDNESAWQKYFEENSWILQQVFAQPVIFLQGETYVGGKNTKGRQGQGGSATDFLFQNSTNGSFSVVEIKTPRRLLVGTCYRGCETEGENTVYRMSGELSGAIVQLQKQICTAIEYFKASLGEDFQDLNLLWIVTHSATTLDLFPKLSPCKHSWAT